MDAKTCCDPTHVEEERDEKFIVAITRLQAIMQNTIPIASIFAKINLIIICSGDIT